MVTSGCTVAMARCNGKLTHRTSENDMVCTANPWKQHQRPNHSVNLYSNSSSVLLPPLSQMQTCTNPELNCDDYGKLPNCQTIVNPIDHVLHVFDSLNYLSDVYICNQYWGILVWHRHVCKAEGHKVWLSALAFTGANDPMHMSTRRENYKIPLSLPFHLLPEI